ncbi:MAG: acyltransferase [Oscillospiraceae bacterium]|nr:acyltransferase [Oscillospiraceae bacterium]
MEQKHVVNHKLNFLKGVACIGVVFVHVSFPGTFGGVSSYAAGFAVPIFFMIAGYFAWEVKTETIKRRLLKIAKIFIFAYLLFFAYSAAIAIKNQNLGFWLSTHFNWKTAIKYIFFCTVDFAIPLWYLIAMIETYVLWFFVVKHKKEQLAVKFLPYLFLLQILFSICCDVLQVAWSWKTNFIVRALPWFLLGYYLHTEKAENIRKTASYKVIILAVAGGIISVIPALVSLPFQVSTVGYILYALGLFVLCLKDPNNSTCKFVEYLGEKLSLNIYIFHTLVEGVLVLFCGKLLSMNIQENAWLWCKPIIVLICTISVAWAVHVVLDTIKSKS